MQVSQGYYLMTCEKINQNTAIINYQNTSYYVHCWRLPKEVKQKTVSASVPWDKGLWRTQSRQDKLLLEDKKYNGSCMCCGYILMIFCNALDFAYSSWYIVRRIKALLWTALSFHLNSPTKRWWFALYSLQSGAFVTFHLSIFTVLWC